MNDQLGNRFDVGDYVIYTTTGPSITPSVGQVIEAKDHVVTIRAKSGRTITRLRFDVIVYKGIAP